MATNFRAVLTVDHNNHFFKIDASYQCRNVPATRLDDADSGAEISEIHHVTAWTFDAQGNTVDYPCDSVPEHLEDRLCDLAFNAWLEELHACEPEPGDEDPTADDEGGKITDADLLTTIFAQRCEVCAAKSRISREQARERVALKRELRRLGVAFDTDASTDVLKALKRLADLETLLGDLFDGCINPLAAVTMQFDSDRPAVPQDFKVLVERCVQKFVSYRKEFDRIIAGNPTVKNRKF